MFKTLLVSFLILFTACSNKSPKPLNTTEKAFDAEDTYIIFALRAEQVGDYKAAAQLFNELYKKSEKKEYLYRYLKDTLIVKDYNEVIKTVDNVSNNKIDDPTLIRYKIIALLQTNKLQEAINLSLLLAKKTNEVKDHLLVSDAYIKNKEYDLALNYLQGVYVKEYNEQILDKIAVILYTSLDRKKEAIEELETHSKIHGCSQIICNRLISFYSHENNIDALLAIYKRLYAKEKKEVYAEKIIQIYSYKKEYVKLMDFLEANPINDELLLQLYLSGKNYKKASQLAYKLYKESGDYNYLGQSAIYKYESYRGDVPKKVLRSVIDDLERVAKYENNTLYLNYLGYILIDHEIDVKKGLSYIKEVLKKEPESAYYLDSLAWGYYKLGKCYKAKKIIDKVMKLGVEDEPEVQEHLQKINRCIKKGKK